MRLIDKKYMDSKITLIRPRKSLIPTIEIFRDEIADSKSFPFGTNKITSFPNIEQWLKTCRDWEKGINLPDGFCPMTQLVLLRKSDQKILGMLNIKHNLNDFRLKYIGHIAYSVAPPERNAGYGTLMLHMAIPYCRKLGINKIYVFCHSNNPGSRKVILNNGGQYESTVFDEKMKCNLERYWIATN